MDAAIIHEKEKTIYSYTACLRWCLAHMARPSADHSHRGTFGCNGVYVWRGYSNGRDANPDDLPVIDKAPHDWHGVEGSNELYSFRAWNTEPTEPELELWFVPCYCRSCRAADYAACRYRNTTQAPSYVLVTRKAVAARRARRVRGARAADGSSGDDD